MIVKIEIDAGATQGLLREEMEAAARGIGFSLERRVAEKDTPIVLRGREGQQIGRWMVTDGATAFPPPGQDAAALDRIAELLDDVEWEAGDLDRIAEIVNETGRLIRSPHDDEDIDELVGKADPVDEDALLTPPFANLLLHVVSARHEGPFRPDAPVESVVADVHVHEAGLYRRIGRMEGLPIGVLTTMWREGAKVSGMTWTLEGGR